MGEYALRGNTKVKIGTCELMYYLRYEDRDKVLFLPGNIDPASETGLFWRLPYPDEDNILPGNYDQYNRGERLYKTVKRNGEDYPVDFSDPETIDSPGNIQLTHPSGLLLNVPCYHGEKLPEAGGIKVFWNGRAWFYELAFVKNLPDGSVKPIVHCRHCGKMWRYDWEEILPYLHGKMKKRLEKHAEGASSKEV